MLIDPVVPRHADGLTFDFEWEGRPVRYRYAVKGQGFAPTEVRINGAPVAARRATDNPYREGGLLISKRAFSDALDKDENLVEILRLILNRGRADGDVGAAHGAQGSAAAAANSPRPQQGLQRDGLGMPGRGAGCASIAGSSAGPPTSSQIRTCRLSRMKSPPTTTVISATMIG